jgi:WD40 repeat protein
VAALAIAGPTRIVSGGSDGVVASVDLLASGFRVLGRHDHPVNQVAVDLSGSLAASCSSDPSVAVWDLETGEQRWVRCDHRAPVDAVAFLPGGLVASTDRRGRLVVRDPADGTPVREQEGLARVITLSAAGVVVSGADDGTFSAWSVVDGSLLGRWGPFRSRATSAAIDRAAASTAVGFADGSIVVVRLASAEPIVEAHAHRSAVKALDFAGNGRLLSAGYDQAIQLRNVDDRLTLHAETPAPSGLWERTVAWGPNEGDLMGGTFDGTIIYWPAVEDLPRRIGADGLGNACATDAQAHGGVLALVADDGIVRRLARGTDGSLRVEASGVPRQYVRMGAVAIDRGDGSLVTGSHDHSIQRWRLQGRSLVQVNDCDLGAGPVRGLAVCPDGDLLVATYGGAVVQTDRTFRVRRRLMFHTDAVSAVRIHPSGLLAGCCSADGSARLWDIRTGLVTFVLDGDGNGLRDLAFSPDGSLVSVVGNGSVMTTYTVADGRRARQTRLRGQILTSATHTSNSRVLVGDERGGVTRIDLATGRTRCERVADDRISAMALLDGLPIAVSVDGGIFVLDAGGSPRQVTRLIGRRSADLDGGPAHDLATECAADPDS